MARTQRATVYLDRRLYRALKVKAALTDQPISSLLNEALAWSLREDAIDIEAVRRRSKEPSRAFSDILDDLKREGLLW